MSDALKLLALAFQTRTKLCFDGHMFHVVPGKNLPEGALKRLYAAQSELAELVCACISFELTPEEQEEIGREMYEEYCERERAELEAKGICPHCRGTRVLCDDDGAPDEPCVECIGERSGEFVDDVTQEPDGSPEPRESLQVPLDPVATAPSPEAS
ncbi:MAG: hypothetical protein HUU28_08070 [Planctomycetaceae bacterium]|nr:hypothetical protein [Planctomycetaceae bacterium]